MEIRLAENIRNFRKERALTQEQLSEVLGVTAGAVYKWEAKLSVPELDLIIQMADFFDTSVDVLLGYEIKDNRLEATVNYPCLKARASRFTGNNLTLQQIGFRLKAEGLTFTGLYALYSGETGLPYRFF